jgi:hypothetical protein
MLSLVGSRDQTLEALVGVQDQGHEAPTSDEKDVLSRGAKVRDDFSQLGSLVVLWRRREPCPRTLVPRCSRGSSMCHQTFHPCWEEKDALAPVEDLIPVDVQALATRPLAPAGDYEKEALTPVEYFIPVEDLISVEELFFLKEDVANQRLARLRGLHHWVDVINSNVLVKVKNSMNLIILNMTLLRDFI